MGADEVQDFTNWVRDRGAAAAGVEQSDRARIRSDVFDQERTRIAAVQEAAVAVRDDDLPGEGFRERRAASTFIFVSDADCRVEAADRAVRQAGGASALWEFLYSQQPQ